jgi:hypothetical protein
MKQSDAGLTPLEAIAPRSLDRLADGRLSGACQQHRFKADLPKEISGKGSRPMAEKLTASTLRP